MLSTATVLGPLKLTNVKSSMMLASRFYDALLPASWTGRRATNQVSESTQAYRYNHHNTSLVNRASKDR